MTGAPSTQTTRLVAAIVGILVLATIGVVAIDEPPAHSQAAPSGCGPSPTWWEQEVRSDGRPFGAPGGNVAADAIRLQYLGGHPSPLYAWAPGGAEYVPWRIIVSPSGSTYDAPNLPRSFRIPPNTKTIVFCLEPVALPDISLTKAADPTVVSAPGTIDYTLVATNTGDVDLSGVTVTDPALGALACSPSVPTTLAIGASLTCTGSRAVTQADIDAGSTISNTATASGTHDGNSVVDTATALVDVVQEVSLDLDKSADVGVVSEVGPLGYTIVATNTGNTTLTDVVVDDPDLGALACSPSTPATLTPGATITCTGTRTITQADLDAGLPLANTATATGSTGATRTTATDRAVVLIDRRPDLTIAKSADVTEIDAPGPVSYTVVVTNTGNTTVDDVTVSDPTLGALSCTPTTPTSLAPTQQITCTATRTITQADLDDGDDVTNTATATGTSAGRTIDAADTVDIPVVQDEDLAVTKTASVSQITAAGDVGYTIVTTNTGNTTIANVQVTDSQISPLSCTPATPVDLAPGASITCTGTRTVTQPEIDAGGPILNVVLAAGETDSNRTIGAGISVVPVDPTPALTVEKSSTNYPDTDDDSLADDELTGPDTVDYSIVATNSGATTLTGVEVADPSLADLSCLPATPATLAPGASITCTGSRAISQADIDDGIAPPTGFGLPPTPIAGILNITTVTADGGLLVRDLHAVRFDQTPDLTLTKVPDAATVSVPGPVGYTIVATNTGVVTLTDVTVDDPDLGALSCTPAQPATLAPGATMSCDGTRTVSQDDIDDGTDLVNTATAEGTFQGEQVPATATATVAIDQLPDLTVTKTSSTSADADDDGIADTAVSAPGPVGYTIVATNTGNTTLTGVDVVDDTLGALACSPAVPATLAPGASITCTGTDTVAQADIDDGRPLLGDASTPVAALVNVVVAGNDEVDAADFFIVPLAREPRISLAKSADVPRVESAGPVTYTLVATNTGNTTLADVVVDDPDLGALSCTPSAPATLAPGATITCTGTRTVSQDEIDAGGDVTNSATASSTAATDTATSDLPILQLAAITLSKTPSALEVPANTVSDVTWSIEVTNSGNLTLAASALVDALVLDLGDARVQAQCTRALGTLAPGITVTIECTARDVAIGTADIANVAIVAGSTDAGIRVAAGDVAVVRPTDAGGGGLARTGVDLRYAVWASLAVTVGALLVVGARRRARA